MVDGDSCLTATFVPVSRRRASLEKHGRQRGVDELAVTAPRRRGCETRCRQSRQRRRRGCTGATWRRPRPPWRGGGGGTAGRRRTSSWRNDGAEEVLNGDGLQGRWLGPTAATSFRTSSTRPDGVPNSERTIAEDGNVKEPRFGCVHVEHRLQIWMSVNDGRSLSRAI